MSDSRGTAVMCHGDIVDAVFETEPSLPPRALLTIALTAISADAPDGLMLAADRTLHIANEADMNASAFLDFVDAGDIIVGRNITAVDIAHLGSAGGMVQWRCPETLTLTSLRIDGDRRTTAVLCGDDVELPRSLVGRPFPWKGWSIRIPAAGHACLVARPRYT